MSKKIESDALVLVNRQLGLAGGTQAPTFLDDGNVSLVLGITDAVRRARAPGSGDGWFYCIMENVHPVADDQTSQLDPYAPGALVPTISGHPGRVQLGFDVWVIDMTLLRTAGAGALTGGVLFFQGASQSQGWGVNQAGALVTTSGNLALARWASLNTSISGFSAALTGDGNFVQRIVRRIPRGGSLRLITESAAAATFRGVLGIGVFPEGLGQDLAQ